MINCIFRILFLLALTCLSITLQARDVLVSGNGFDESAHIFATNLAQIDLSI